MTVSAPPPFRIKFDEARDPYAARNALGIIGPGGSLGGGGGGGGAPLGAQYITAASDATLTNERVLTNTATVTWDFSTPGQAKASTAAGGGNVSNSGTPTSGQYGRWVTATTIAGVTPAMVLADIGAQPAGSYQTQDATLTALAAYNTNGLLTQTAPDTFTGRSIAVPAAGISITNANGVAGNPTLALADDLAVLEALTGTNTIYYRSGTSAWTAVTVGTGLSFTGGNLTSTVTQGAPVGAEYITSTADATLSAERVLTDSATITWDRTVAGQIKANSAAGGGNVSTSGTITTGLYAKWVTGTTIQSVANATVLSDIGAAPVGAEYITSSANATLSAERVLTNTTSITWDFATASQGKANLAALTGDVTTTAAGVATTIAANAVTYAKMQDVSAASRLIGRGSASGAGDPQEITLGTGLTMTGTVLASSAGGGNVSNSGTPAAGEVAEWVTATTIKGTAKASLGFVLKTGDTMSGDLTIAKAAPFFNIQATSGQSIINIQSAASGSGAALQFVNVSSPRWVLSGVATASESGANAGSNLSFFFYTDAGSFGGASMLMARSTGQISLGPHAANSNYFGGADVAIMCGGTIGLEYRGVVAGSLNFATQFVNAGAAVTGYIYFDDTTTTYTTSSDARLKTDAQPFANGRDIIDQISIKQFRWKESGAQGVGVLAQEVRDAYPAAVCEGRGDIGQDDFMPWAVDYSKYVPLLIQALQEAFREIDKLKKGK